MADKHPNIWKWLPFIALGLMLAGNFAPVSDPLDNILLGAAIALLFTFSGSYYWQEWRERKADQSSSAAIPSGDQT